MRIIFHHIPKTGGTTVHLTLLKELGLSLHPQRHSGFAEMPLGKLTPFDLFSAHMTRADIERLRALDDVLLVTVLREPVARYLSEYDYLRTRPDRALRRVDNADALLEARRLPPEAFFHSAVERRIDNRMLRSVCQVSGEVTLQDVESAIEYLEGFDLVGLTDYMDEFLELIFERFGRERGFDPQFANTSWEFVDPKDGGGDFAKTARSSVSEETWRRLTWADQEVYRHFEKKFRREHCDRICRMRKAYAALLIDPDQTRVASSDHPPSVEVIRGCKALFLENLRLKNQLRTVSSELERNRAHLEDVRRSRLMRLSRFLRRLSGRGGR